SALPRHGGRARADLQVERTGLRRRHHLRRHRRHRRQPDARRPLLRRRHPHQLDRHAERSAAHPLHRHHPRRAKRDGAHPFLSAMNYGRNLFAVTAASFIGFMGFTLVMPFLPLYFHLLGVEDVGRVAMWSGLSLGVTPALTAMLAPAWGRLADRFGRKIMVERSLGSFVVVTAAMAFVTRPWHVFALRMVQGLFAGYGALTLTMAADSAPKGKMGQAIGTVQTAQRLGPALGPVFGGSIAALVGLRRAFMVAGACYLIAVIIVFFMYHEGPVQPHAAPSGEKPRPVTFRNVLAFEDFLLMAVVIFGFQFVDRSFGPVLPLYVGELGISS